MSPPLFTASQAISPWTMWRYRRTVTSPTIRQMVSAVVTMVSSTKYNGQLVFCKHRERETYEVPGGHREAGETILETAKRELAEETGAVGYTIRPVCVYSVTGRTRVNDSDDEELFGMLFFAEVNSFGDIHSEIEKIIFCYELTDNWTYPQIQPKLLKEAARRGFI